MSFCRHSEWKWGHSVYQRVYTLVLKSLPFFLFFWGLWAEKELMCANTQNSTLTFKRQPWLTATKDVFLMICLDMQLEMTLQSDMDQWVYRSLSELTSKDLSSLPAFCLSQIKSKIFIGMNGSWVKKTLSSIFLLHNIQYSNIYIESRVLWLLQKDGTFTWKEGEFKRRKRKEAEEEWERV